VSPAPLGVAPSTGGPAVRRQAAGGAPVSGAVAAGPTAHAVAVDRVISGARPAGVGPVDAPVPASPQDPSASAVRLAPPAAGGTVRGRVQRRPVELSHPRPTAAAPAPATAPVSSVPAAATPTTVAPTTAGPEVAQPAGTAGFTQALGDDLGEMVLASWSLEEAHEGTGRGPSGDSREARFAQIAGPALDRLNEQRLAAGQDQLVALPPDEEQRIWTQVDAGGAGPVGSGPHADSSPPIRSWADFGGALRNDVLDEVGGFWGMDAAQLTHADSPAAPAAAPAARPESPADHNHAEHRAVDTDDLDLEELTARLYDRIRSRLRRELLLDRERAGLLSDFR
jgi:hypothetical protein